MRKYRFALVGGGWRAAFFARIAQQMPERFELAGTYLRSVEKRAEWQARYGGITAESIDKLYEQDVDFVVLAVAKTASTPILLDLIRRKKPILCETPPAVTQEGLEAVWDAVCTFGTCVQVAQQYPYQPYYSACKKIIDSGLLGELSVIDISTVHSYHAVALIRWLFGLRFENARISGERFSQPVRRTAGRAGFLDTDEVVEARRDRVTFQFENGKTAFFDFSPEQYFSAIRNRHIRIQGVLGEIANMEVFTVGKGGFPIRQSIKRLDVGVNNNNAWSHGGLTLGEEVLYQNAFPGCRLNDDEIAVAVCMERMGRLCNGENITVYPVEEALQDACFALEMEKALVNPGQRVHTSFQKWAKTVR